VNVPTRILRGIDFLETEEHEHRLPRACGDANYTKELGMH